MSINRRYIRIALTVWLLTVLQIWLCLVHISLSLTQHTSSNDPYFATVDHRRLNRLRRDWTTLRPYHSLSPLAQQLYSHQHNCTLPSANFWFRNRFGLGSDLHVWSQAVCNAMQHQVRIRSIGPWIWQSRVDCATRTSDSSNKDDSFSSPMACYFPLAEPDCSWRDSMNPSPHLTTLNLTKGRGVLINNACRDIREERNVTVSAWRAAAMEYLFSTLSLQLQIEANRQMHLVFPNGVIPTDLITVHIRWGDKEDEMKLVPMSDYIRAVVDLAKDLQQVHVYLSTTDPSAVYEFVSQSPKEWKIYIDAYFQEYYKQQLSSNRNQYNQNPSLSLKHDGKPGFMALASLLVALEANAFVLTTASNWSRLLNELRQSILDPECDHCTRMIDLRPGEW
ncbi:hypothetical protein FisN_23Lh073 [Fistulifera solaris]|uniref:Uncharacterized protein n=1 Tax=Fistulifera solaris TaxID=1519565 RepID=A0A1Z5KK95_FISSO|nr:hypothetical protein FisN_23Lh073 [Fistulifera solaris]|eukprot:GAX26545.1 hypothetical protein FisN_23Lh073 [Fistulifera solaris]